MSKANKLERIVIHEGAMKIGDYVLCSAEAIKSADKNQAYKILDTCRASGKTWARLENTSKWVDTDYLRLCSNDWEPSFHGNGV